MPDGTASYGYDINNNGQAAGNYYTGTGSHAFYYNGGLVDINPALGNPTNGSYAESLNDNGLTTGYFYDGSYNSHSFIYSPNSNTAQDLSSAFPAGTTNNYAYGINNSGQVVGQFYTGGPSRAFLYSGGTVQDLTSAFPIGTDYSRANAINNNGKVVGEFDTPSNDHAFYYSNGTATDLNPALGNPDDAYAYAINNSNVVVGEAYPSSGNDFAFVYSNGNVTNLNNYLPGTGLYSYAYGINDSGTVVGEFYSDQFSSSHAFVYANGIALDLNNLIDPSSGWVLTEADAVNNSGQITGYGTIGGQSRAFVLNLRGVSGFGTIGNGNNRSTFLFNATSRVGIPDAVGTLTFTTKSGVNLQNAAITSLSYSGNTATFSGTFSRGKGNAPGRFVVTIDSSAQTFSIALYNPNQASPYFTRSGPLTNGYVSTSGGGGPIII